MKQFYIVTIKSIWHILILYVTPLSLLFEVIPFHMVRLCLLKQMRSFIHVSMLQAFIQAYSNILLKPLPNMHYFNTQLNK